MSASTISGDDHALLATIHQLLAVEHSARHAAHEEIVQLDLEEASLGYHPNFVAYLYGGQLTDKEFGAPHILAVLGFHDLEWADALARLRETPVDTDDDLVCLIVRLRHVCEADAMLEVAGHALLADLALLKRGSIDRFWLSRPKFGLGQAAKAFGLEPGHAAGHRGLYTLTVDELVRRFGRVAAASSDRRFGALLPAVIAAGGSALAAIGAQALHRDAERRYREDCRRFAKHQRLNQSRRWRWKSPLSRQGHLAVTTARAQDVAIPAERTRGHAANWLSDHDANIRFTWED